ncbi:thiolase family protein [Pseudaquabacterium pictum]|uniref:propanoyl-CoA C-acyltransferase n=1 Tax=Pseudaquabacterium pictum TaxID=2315236 RepID=A0A480AHF0_9BURK|nr:thiolase family protein [Rubrivivax pictus]GCL61189.1 thiolase [Rubrivivax pictus]
MPDAYLIGTSCTRFGKQPGASFKDLTRQAYLAVLADAGLDSGDQIANAWFGNCGMAQWGQGNIRGQVCFTPLVREGLFPERVGMTNVEGGCATASMALHGAWKDVLSGTADLSLAMGVEKTYVPETVPDAAAKQQAIFDNGIDQLDPADWMAYYAAAGEEAGKPFLPKDGGGTLFMDTYAMQAAWHIKHHGSTPAQIAIGASKNHAMGAKNPLAQYRFEVSPEQVLADRMVSWPLTRSMCAPIGDGAAAALVCSEAFLKTLPAAVRERALRIPAAVLTGGKYRRLDEPGLSHLAARRAYAMAGITPQQVSVAEVHDATSFCELYQAEMMGFCPMGQGGAWVASGATSFGGVQPINLSGGLVSKGHPVGATGLSMVHELALQLRGEAGERQHPGAHIGLAENGGGVMGFDEAACAVTILQRC